MPGSLKRTAVIHQINNHTHPSYSQAHPSANAHICNAATHLHWEWMGGAMRKRKKRKREVGPGCDPTWEFPQQSSHVVSYSSTRPLRREARNSLCSSGRPSIKHRVSMAHFPPFFLFFLPGISLNISWSMQKKAKSTLCSTRNTPVGVETDAPPTQIFCCRAREKLLAASIRAREVTPPPEPPSRQAFGLKQLKVCPIYMCLMVSQNVLSRLVLNLILPAKRKHRAGHRGLLKPHITFGFAVS